jgi:hypothetical protein
MYYKLIRQNSSSPASSESSKAVTGKLYRVSHYFNKRTGELVERPIYLCDTLENADYLIPALIYKVQVTQSPRFKRLLPVLTQVPGRSGIRFHRGSQPEHSKGCILVSASMEQSLTARWLSEQSASEETRLEICNNINFYRNEKAN